MRAASAGPIRGRRSSSAAVARSTSTRAADSGREPAPGRVFGMGVGGATTTPMPRSPSARHACSAGLDVPRACHGAATLRFEPGRPFPDFAPARLPRLSTAPADSTATICRRSASRDAASACSAPRTAFVILTAPPTRMTPVRKISALFSEGVGTDGRSVPCPLRHHRFPAPLGFTEVPRSVSRSPQVPRSVSRSTPLGARIGRIGGRFAQVLQQRTATTHGNGTAGDDNYADRNGNHTNTATPNSFENVNCSRSRRGGLGAIRVMVALQRQ